MKTEKVFLLNDQYSIKCTWQSTRYGFRHLASLISLPDYNEVCKTKACYYNRTWESFEYESVIQDLLRKTDLLTDEQKNEFLNRIRQEDHEEVNSMFKSLAGIMQLGAILTDNKKDANDWKTRMLKAGLGDKGLIMPDDWNELPEEDKEQRLNNVIKQFTT
jgi:hypothetical protein